MASGGRRRTTWEAGNAKGAGRKPGAKDEVPRAFKASVKAVYEQIVSDEPDILINAIRRGLAERNAKARFPYVRMLAELQGELRQQIDLNATVTVDDERLRLIHTELERLAASHAGRSTLAPAVVEQGETEADHP
jgi:hypothetical protein